MAFLAAALAAGCADDDRTASVRPATPNVELSAAATQLETVIASAPARRPAGPLVGGRTTASWYDQTPSACYDDAGRHAHPAGLRFWTAHRTLPCGTILEVCHAAQPGRCVTVEVRDRGPYVAGRDLHLSLGAFDRLADPKAGVVRVVWRLIR